MTIITIASTVTSTSTITSTSTSTSTINITITKPVRLLRVWISEGLTQADS